MQSNRILIPTNFSNQANTAFKQCIYFSQKTNSEVYLLHVISKIKNNYELNADKYIDYVQNKFDRLVEEIEGDKVPKIHYRIESGKVLPQILATEKEVSPSFIFLGTDISANEITSITLRLIDNVRCPMVIIRNVSNRIGCDNIVLPLDLTKETKQKIDLTIKLARIYGSMVHIVSVTSLVKEDELLVLENQIKQVQAIFTKLKIKSTTKLLKTKNDVEIMANAINDYADDIKSDLIIIMTRQEKKLQKFFVGSMATKLIKKASAPILCVSPKS